VLAVTAVTDTGPDLEALADIFTEMTRFYDEALDVHSDKLVAELRDILFGSRAAGYALLARGGAQTVGFATYSFLWPAAGLTRSLYLKELYVARAFRQQGVGSRLMRQLAQIALDVDCSRLEWTTDRDNASARAFYDELGAKVGVSKLFYRVEGVTRLRELAAER
jgi:GNAT superfamily N-acetyltransferase